MAEYTVQGKVGWLMPSPNTGRHFFVPGSMSWNGGELDNYLMLSACGRVEVFRPILEKLEPIEQLTSGDCARCRKALGKPR